MCVERSATKSITIIYPILDDHGWKFIRSILGESKKHVIPTLKDALELKANDRIHATEYKKIPTEGW